MAFAPRKIVTNPPTPQNPKGKQAKLEGVKLSGSESMAAGNSSAKEGETFPANKFVSSSALNKIPVV